MNDAFGLHNVIFHLLCHFCLLLSSKEMGHESAEMGQRARKNTARQYDVSPAWGRVGFRVHCLVHCVNKDWGWRWERVKLDCED